MKIKKTLFLLGLMFGLMTLMSTTCNTEDDDPANPDCNGYAQMTATGYINNTFCFDDNPQFSYEEDNQLVIFSAIVTIDGIIYSCGITINDFTGTKSYTCGPDNPGYVELIIHGDENEFYKSQSGTLNVTQAGADDFVATFDVTAKGYYNGETVTLKGSVSRIK